MDYKAFQAEHKVWLDSEFPAQIKEFPALGIIEEAGAATRASQSSADECIWRRLEIRKYKLAR